MKKRTCWATFNAYCWLTGTVIKTPPVAWNANLGKNWFYLVKIGKNSDFPVFYLSHLIDQNIFAIPQSATRAWGGRAGRGGARRRTRTLYPGSAPSLHQPQQLHTNCLSDFTGQWQEMDIFLKVKTFQLVLTAYRYALMVFKVFQKLFTHLYNYQFFICFFEITY